MVTAKKSFIVLFVLFSAMGIFKDPFGMKQGYSAIWLMVLYCIGALAKKIKLFESRKSGTLILLWLACVFVTWWFHVFKGDKILTNYISPTVLMSGLIMVILFSRLNLKGNIIRKLSPLAFGIYLFQLNSIIWNNILKEAFVFVASKNIVTGVCYAFILAFMIFLGGIIVEFIRTKLAQAVRIPALCERIVSITDRIIMRLFVLLK